MRPCLNCGQLHEETAVVCARCHQMLPPAAPTAPGGQRAPIQLSAGPPTQDGPRKGRQYLLGLGLGLIPLLLFFLSIGLAFNSGSSNVVSVLLLASLLLYIASIIAMIICLVNQNVRFVGYGLLTTVLASPVIGVVGCVVIVASSLQKVH
jgi:hypothetical protein